MGKRIEKVKTHIREKKGYYLVGGGGILVGVLSVVAVSQTRSDGKIVQKILQVAWRPENYQTVITLQEKSTPSKPVHLKGTNLYFNSLSEAARETGHPLATISKQINGHIPDVKGDVFEVLERAN
jgi:hypothetical protein